MICVDVTHTKWRRGNIKGDGHLAKRKASQGMGTLRKQRTRSSVGLACRGRTVSKKETRLARWPAKNARTEEFIPISAGQCSLGTKMMRALF